jgi:RHS repeat-associated protein
MSATVTPSANFSQPSFRTRRGADGCEFSRGGEAESYCARIPRVSGNTYQVSMWVRADAGTTARAMLWVHDTNGGNSVQSSLFTPGTAWQQVTLNFTADNTNLMRIHLYFSAGSGTIYYDDVQVQMLNSVGDTSITTHKFTGDERDPETSFDHTQFRQYTSQLARWISPDPAGLAAVDPSNPQSWNRYSYVINDPINALDPLGLDLISYTNAAGQQIGWDYIIVTAPGGDIFFGVGFSDRPCPHLYDGGCSIGSPNGGDDNGTGRSHRNTSGNSSPSPTWAAIKTFFTPPSTGPGSCLAVFSNSVQGSAGSAARSLATNVQKYGAALASGLGGSSMTAAQGEEVLGAMVAGGQLSPAAGAVATNLVSGTAEVASAAAPYVVRAGGTFAVGLFDVALLKGVADELRAALKGQCKP